MPVLPAKDTEMVLASALALRTPRLGLRRSSVLLDRIGVAPTPGRHVTELKVLGNNALDVHLLRSRAPSAACPAGSPSASVSSARTGPPAPSARWASSGHTAAAENTVPPRAAPAHRAVNPFTARTVLLATPTAPPVTGPPPTGAGPRRRPSSSDSRCRSCHRHPAALPTGSDGAPPRARRDRQDTP